jgi:hypothetical protein
LYRLPQPNAQTNAHETASVTPKAFVNAYLLLPERIAVKEYVPKANHLVICHPVKIWLMQKLLVREEVNVEMESVIVMMVLLALLVREVSHFFLCKCQ